MDREILFRGFHKCEDGNVTIYVEGTAYKGKWIYGVPYQYQNGDVSILTYNITMDIETYAFDVIPITVGQYTSLNGNDNKRIFEGDTCKATLFNFDGSDTQYTGEVTYYDGCFFIINDISLYCALHEFEEIEECIEITGTIFDKQESENKTNE